MSYIIAKYNFTLRQEELEASNGDDKKGRSKYGAKKVNDIESKEFFELSTLFLLLLNRKVFSN